MQEVENDGTPANQGAAYGASPLVPFAGAGAGVTAGTPLTGVNHEVQPMPRQPVSNDSTIHNNDMQNNQPDLSLPFEPVTLAFKDVHYYVKPSDGRGELELLKARFFMYSHDTWCDCTIQAT